MVKGKKIKVEYECTPIRHLAIQCPVCQNWFCGVNITLDDIDYSYQIDGAKCHCPKCDEDFEVDLNSKDSEIDNDTDFPEFYKQCLTKKTVWE